MVKTDPSIISFKQAEPALSSDEQVTRSSKNQDKTLTSSSSVDQNTIMSLLGSSEPAPVERMLINNPLNPDGQVFCYTVDQLQELKRDDLSTPSSFTPFELYGYEFFEILFGYSIFFSSSFL